jgi:hypothetical protein
VAVVDEDQSPLSRRIVGAFYKPYFRQPAALTLAELDREMDLGTYNFTLVIPNHFQHDVLAGRQPEIQLNIDATIMSQAIAESGVERSCLAFTNAGEIWMAGQVIDDEAPFRDSVAAPLSAQLPSIFRVFAEITRNLPSLANRRMAWQAARTRYNSYTGAFGIEPREDCRTIAGKVREGPDRDGDCFRHGAPEALEFAAPFQSSCPHERLVDSALSADGVAPHFRPPRQHFAVLVGERVFPEPSLLRQAHPRYAHGDYPM